MRYEVELENDAARLLDEAPIDLAICINEHIEALAEAPMERGRKAHFPYRPVGMIYDFFCNVEGTTWYIVVFYHFEPGERVLRVFGLTRQEIGPGQS